MSWNQPNAYPLCPFSLSPRKVFGVNYSSITNIIIIIIIIIIVIYFLWFKIVFGLNFIQFLLFLGMVLSWADYLVLYNYNKFETKENKI